MSYQKVHVKINKKTGKMTIEGDGFIGNQCDVLEQVEQQLGQVTQTEDKPERHQYLQPDYLPNALNN
jgi:hypothetical protein